ncbi:GNAT family N-acetyltransferase [Nocardioides sp. P5_C9_2]
MEYEHRTLDPHDDSDEAKAAVDAWMGAVSRGFHEGRPSDSTREIWRETTRADSMRLAGAWLPEGAFGAGPLPVATFSSWDMTLNAGAAMVPVHMISDVTVSPAHRRRGLLRTMMVEDLAQTSAPVAALTVSEASIYGRFGFGPASFRRRIEVDTTATFALRDFVDPGRVELVEPADLWDIASDVFARFHASSRGSVERPHFYRAWQTGRYDPATGSADDKLRAAVHLDADERPDGYVLFKHAEGEGDKPATVTAELLTLDTTAHLGLWRFLADIDLSSRVAVRTSHPDDPLHWALVNSDVVGVRSVYDHLWVRVLDVPTALEARPWYADDSLVLGVTDPLGHAEGHWRIDAADGRATVVPTDGDADLTVSAETLASLYLGGVRVDSLATAGRLPGDPAQVARLGRLLDGGPAPYSLTSF